MNIYTKLTITLLVIAALLYLLMFPDSPLAEWAEEKCGGYMPALFLVSGMPLLPIPFIWLVYLWLEL